MKFKFAMAVIVEADSMESALGQITAHIARVSRQAASGMEPGDCGAEFALSDAGAGDIVTDLTDNVTQSKGPIALDLDPKSPAGIEHAAQQEREKSDMAARRASLANAGRSDAEVMAELKERGV